MIGPRRKRRLSKPSEAALLAEYSAANDIYMNFDGFHWQSGAFLIAGVFVYWGFLISGPLPLNVVGVSSLLFAALMGCWLLSAHHNRQIFMFKLKRLWEIEEMLGMEQHRRFTMDSPTGVRAKARGLSGHTIDIIIFVITSTGAAVLGFVRDGFAPFWDLGLILLVAAVVVWVMVLESMSRASAGR